ncbi:DUF294 nucleotidyltransferase-like domain-containing protein [Bacillus solimangrovi]|uniref:Signal transduction protein n=1 Tax=Bacillus solimangrovi TaxID=1305675 RepID=A0A1E5LJU5_9BACI|nr:DUF294 nucleotidyltransferase-like domain-containing protein [Bacillus solimangrovi]OEH94306.1 hypothetical protein BFG57_08600 [Bacillus solimangrovi]
MSVEMIDISTLKEWRDERISKHLSSHEALNYFHDMVMRKAFSSALNDVQSRFGSPPSSYTWFLMGSCGRHEQAIISDQDHGIIFAEDTNQSADYFQRLGELLTENLNELGYPYCDGQVMSSNPKWCKSVDQWKKQLDEWALEESWDSIRYLLIFFDARAIAGDRSLVKELKRHFFELIDEHPTLLKRFSDNTKRLIKGIGLFGNILTKEDDPYRGYLNIKETGFLPYVNNVRLLSIKEEIYETSTVSRIGQLKRNTQYMNLKQYEKNFKKLLYYRLLFASNHHDYEDVHYLDLKLLNRQQLHELKQILKDVEKFHNTVHRLF